MTETIEGFHGTPGPRNWNFARYSGQVAGFHITGPEHGGIYPVCDSGPARADIKPSEMEANAHLLAKSYDLAVLVQKLANSTFADMNTTSGIAQEAVDLKREARALLAEIIGAKS